MRAFLTRRSVVVLIAGTLAGTAWFGYQLSYPPLLRGLVCCDSTVYMTYARMLVRPLGDERPLPVPEAGQREEAAESISEPVASSPRWLLLLQTLFLSTGKYVPGYGFFLAIHIALSNLTGGVVPWLGAALLSAFALQLGAILFFWRSMQKAGIAVPAWAAALVLAHPVLWTHAALPISDTLAIAIALGSLGLLLRIVGSPLTRRTCVLALCMGGLLGALVWVRSIYSVGTVLLLLAWAGLGAYHYARQRGPAMFCCALLALSAMATVLSPRLIACYRASGGICLLTPEDSSTLTAELLGKGFTGARTYTVLRPIEPGAGALITVPDTFLQSFQCQFTPENPKGQLWNCMLQNWWKMPWFGALKIMGLLDAPHLSTYVTNGTHPLLRLLLRLTMLPVIAGLLGSAWLAIASRRRHAGWNLILFWTAICLGSVAPLAIEPRYGMIAIPIGLLGLGALTALWRTTPAAHKWGIGVLVTVCISGFWGKTAQWDRLDPIPYVPASIAVTEDVLRPIIESLPRAVTE